MSERVECIYCEASGDLRPYGPRGEWVCFACATSTLEREAQTKTQFISQLEHAGPIAMIDGTNVGLYPARHSCVEIIEPATERAGEEG